MQNCSQECLKRLTEEVCDQSLELWKQSPNNAEVQIDAELLRMKAKETNAPGPSNSVPEDAELV